MKKLILLIFIFIALGAISQTPNPKNEDFNSIGMVGDDWKQVLGPIGNAGAHNGELCYNVTGTYIDDSYYSFEGDTLDLSLWFEVEATILISSNLRNGDRFYFYYLDGADNQWYGWDISGAIGTYVLPLPITTRLLSFDLNTYANGNVNGKYAHVDFIYLSDPGISLPVELLYFEGETCSGNNCLNWATASEINSDYYDIMWSRDAYEWNSVGTVHAAGNSNMNLYYSFVDEGPLPVINYYKLIQYDFDGQYKEYAPIAIDNRIKERIIIKYVNLFGQVVDPKTSSGFIIGIYEDGTTIKMMINN